MIQRCCLLLYSDHALDGIRYSSLFSLHVDLSETRHQVREFSALKSQKLKAKTHAWKFAVSTQQPARVKDGFQEECTSSGKAIIPHCYITLS
jgi:hypothetical protein